ncbi:MAG TPA: fatty acid desaturase, partial [Thermoanaerobaculia bacterium]|nr:fatty acid desaturase [Thermoanaerobaculia bacterium]
MYLLVGLSICAGYHRFFSHKTYDASPLVQVFYAFFGAMAAQNSILWWSSSHRTHHKHVDQDWDPYNIKRGFWWAHIFWIFYRNPAAAVFDNAPDLQKNPVVMWQHRWHKVILVVGGFGIPALIGYAMGDWIAGLLWGGFLRIAVVHHSTFFVNSLAHQLGKPSFDVEVSARDNWMVALLTLGEGYHSFHHRFATDYRNGIRWFQWDPSKWFIQTLSAMGLARNLKVTPAAMIEQARMQAALRTVETRLASAPASLAEECSQRIERATESLQEAFVLWREHLAQKVRDRAATRAARRQVKLLVREARREWRVAVRRLASLPKAA